MRPDNPYEPPYCRHDEIRIWGYGCSPDLIACYDSKIDAEILPRENVTHGLTFYETTELLCSSWLVGPGLVHPIRPTDTISHTNQE